MGGFFLKGRLWGMEGWFCCGLVWFGYFYEDLGLGLGFGCGRQKFLFYYKCLYVIDACLWLFSVWCIFE